MLTFSTLNQDHVMEDHADRWYVTKNIHVEEDYVVEQHMTWNLNSEDHVDGWHMTGINTAKDHVDGWHVTGIIIAEDYGDRHHVTNITAVQ